MKTTKTDRTESINIVVNLIVLLAMITMVIV